MQSKDGGSEKKSVLIFFHGGAWVNGDASDLIYGPDFLLSQDIVLVTVQYRLGIFGLFSLGAGDYTGNMALKDQQLALKWVWNNIENFAGDKQKILIFGESSGALNGNRHKKVPISKFSIKIVKTRIGFLGGAAVHFHMLNKVFSC